MTSVAPGTPEAAAGETPQIRALRRLVMIMTGLLCAGLILLIGRVIYLAARPLAQGAGAGASDAIPALSPRVTLALPAGAAVSAMALTGSKLAVSYRAPGGDGIAIIDLSTGQPLSTVTIEAGLPR